MSGGALEKKQAYFSKLIQLLDEYPKVLIVGADNVGSFHMQSIRKALRGKAVLLMGKNTMVRKAIKGHLGNNPSLEKILPYVKGNIGFVFTKDELSDIAKVINENKVEASARAGIIAPSDVIVPNGPTGLEPTKTSFFQALNITTKIAKGQIDISNDVHLIKKGDKVGSSECALLAMLSIKPFQYGLTLLTIFDSGAIYDSSVLTITTEDLLNSFRRGIQNVASLSLATHYPSAAAVPHNLINGYKKVLSISLATDYNFEKAQKLKDYLANPGAFAAKAPVSTPAKTGGDAPKKGKDAPKVEEKVEEEKEKSDEDMGFGLFD